MKKRSLIAMALAVVMGLTACGGSGANGGKPVNDKVTLQFWGWGDDVEASVFQEITDRFNQTVGAEKNITVKYVQKSEHEGYVRLVSQNQHHADKEVEISRIRAIALIKASVRMHTIG